MKHLLTTILNLSLAATVSLSPVHHQELSADSVWTSRSALSAHLTHANGSVVSLQLTNHASAEVQLLRWNSFLDAGTEHYSFVAADLETGQRLGPGPSMVHKYYGSKLRPDDLLKLPANGTWSGVFDMATLFNVPKSGHFEVTFTAQAVVIRHGRISSVEVVSNQLILYLNASKAKLRSKRDQISGCDAGQTWVLHNALESAKTLARQAYENTPNGPTVPGTAPWYPKYFNDQSWDVVKSVFRRISQYEINASMGLAWECGSETGHCSDGEIVAFLDDELEKITLCLLFFERPSSSACGVPGLSKPSFFGVEGGWQRPPEQPAVILHEMLHSQILTGSPNAIFDGPQKPPNENPGHYSYDAVISLAQNAAINGDAPLNNSQNFVYYAMEIRHLLNPSAPCPLCPLRPPTDVCDEAPGSVTCKPCLSNSTLLDASQDQTDTVKVAKNQTSATVRLNVRKMPETRS